MNIDFAALVRRLETAQALQGRSFLRQTQRRDPHGSAFALRGPWGFAHFYAEGHFLNQAVALGLVGPVPSRILDDLERLLGRGGHPIVLELTPSADPDLRILLARRGYRIQAFQQVLAADLGDMAPRAEALSGRVRVQVIASGQADLWRQVVHAGFLNQNELPEGEAVPSALAVGTPGNRFLLATIDGQPAGAALLGRFQKVGVLSATSVLPAFRGRGVQRALIKARLDLARKAGCDRVCAAVLPGTASQENLRRCGLAVVYPKLELVREPGGL